MSYTIRHTGLIKALVMNASLCPSLFTHYHEKGSVCFLH